MKTDQKQSFLRAIKQDIPAVKLFKYRYFIQNNPNTAIQLKDQMIKIALDNKLIGEFRHIHQLLKIKQQQNKNHLVLRQKMIQQTNQLHILEKKYKLQQNHENLAQTLLKLGKLYFSYGDYKQCSNSYDNLTILPQQNHSVKYQDYANQLALSFYFLGESYNLSRFNSKAIDKSVLEKLPQLCIIRDINNIQFRRNMDRPFQNIIKIGVDGVRLSKNMAISYNDIGFLYSLLSIAYKKKSDIGFVKWSSKLQNQFVNNKYKLVLQTIKKQKQSRCFLPITNKVYQQCQSLIRTRILTQVISSFDRCPFSTITQMTGLNQGETRIFVNNSSNINDSSFLYDPVTSSVVYKRNAPLYKQVSKLQRTLQARFEEQLATLDNRRGFDDDDQGIGGLLRRGSGGRMGGAMGGGMGGGMSGRFGGLDRMRMGM